MKNLTIILFVSISHLSSFAQNKFEAIYVFESYGDYETIGSLKLLGDKSWYSRKEEDYTETKEEGYEFYHYKNYLDWYYNLSDKIVIQTREYYRYPNLIARWQADMEWEITEETAEIAGYKVQKAITKPLYEDSNTFPYGKAIAWFTTEIPVSVGPEGYYGLPGLIVKLEYSGLGIFKATLQNIEFDVMEESWEPPSTYGKIEVTKREIYNIGKIDIKWLKQQKKELKAKGER